MDRFEARALDDHIETADDTSLHQLTFYTVRPDGTLMYQAECACGWENLGYTAADVLTQLEMHQQENP